MRVVIRIVGPAEVMLNTKDVQGMIGKWIESYDPDAHDGRGDLRVTANREKALRFSSPGDAMRFWKQQSKKQPLRTDGQPNRPLTAWTVGIEPLF